MKRHLTIITFFLTIIIYSQSTLSALNFRKNDNFHSPKLVSETTTYTTFYNSNNTIEHTKEITSYNSQNNEITELRYDNDDNLKQRLIRIYDSTGTQCIGRKLENWHRYLGHTVETASYNFDSNGYLINVTDKDQNGNIFRKTDITNNEKGDPLELIGYLKDKIVGVEKSKYDYEKNEVTIEYYNSNDELISSQTTIIDSHKINSENIVNEYGDIVKSPTYEMEIKYDKFGNWIKKKYSQIKNGRLIKKSETSRTIKYL
ncbi:hypothetical protein DBB36_11645 [Flavobacterium sp. WLB]|uniref:hypothetical protein n=1 Tax=unclassified Flavobacterium TaxID=196869 RepID=UPI0006ABD97A|nr:MULTISPECIES: hypothetical protein [unclassified Flavobacterium]KOP38091.1 hypothetical protein AKO67_11175 [Flavobacterium sp. VMW]OWU88376.1 hypothetical protein APR43_23380 [Flavobacterium sp. NLM]PUU69869.1 hypothetical protein DBB36_11645 [Flavobacterium sp. WLB]